MNTSSRENRPLLVGLTGGIGSGKTTVSKIFSAFGIKVFNSDVEAKKILASNPEAKMEVIDLFGAVYNEDKLDTKALAAIVFKNPELLGKLNNIVHPRVNKKFEDWVVENSCERILLKEAAILIESGAYKKMDKTILVTAPNQLRIERVVTRDLSTKSEVLKRMESQLSDEEKKKYCDFTIENDGKRLLIPQVQSLLQSLKLIL